MSDNKKELSEIIEGAILTAFITFAVCFAIVKFIQWIAPKDIVI